MVAFVPGAMAASVTVVTGLAVIGLVVGLTIPLVAAELLGSLTPQVLA